MTDLEQAAAAVASGMSVRAAAREHGVSHATLARHVRQAETQPPVRHEAPGNETLAAETASDDSETVRHPGPLPPKGSKAAQALARERLGLALWCSDPAEYTRLRVALLGPGGTVLPPGDGAYGATSALCPRSP